MAKCENCFFYRYSRTDGYDGQQIGTCHYNPPVYGKSWNMFPEVKSWSWCGKWKEYSE